MERTVGRWSETLQFGLSLCIRAPAIRTHLRETVLMKGCTSLVMVMMIVAWACLVPVAPQSSGSGIPGTTKPSVLYIASNKFGPFFVASNKLLSRTDAKESFTTKNKCKCSF